MKKRFGQIGETVLVLKKAGKVFLARRRNTGYHDGEYGLVAGHIEKNETAQEGIIREAKEEAGIKVKSKDLKLIHVFHRSSDSDKSARIGFFWECTKWQGEPHIAEEDKCDKIGWFSLNKIPTNTLPYVKHALKEIKKKNIYSEFNWK
jgi:8-oxo-dGTP pyrophosphatase MutT (NUDIX family)